MHQSLIALGFKLGDMPMWQRFFHSKVGLTLASLVLGIIATLGFAPYHFWVITLVTLGFEFFLVQSLTTKKQVFWSLWLYFTALNAATLSWLNFVMHGFGQMPLPLSWLVEILLSAYLAVFHGLLGCLAFKFAHRRLPAAKSASATSANSADDLEDDDYDDDDDNVIALEEKAQERAHEHSQATASASASAQATATAPTSTTSATVQAQPQTQSQAQSSAQTQVPGKAQALDSDQGHNQDKAQAQANLGEWHLYKNAFLLCFLPVALIAADYIVGWMFTGFPWMYIGYTALEGPFSAYAPLLGVHGITLVMFICAGALALTLGRKYVYLPVAGVLFAIGVFCQGMSFTSPLPAIKITGIQGNIAQQVKWDPRQVMPTISHYVEQTLPYFKHSDLIIWPESALPVFAQEVEPILKDLNTMAYDSHTPLLTGIQHLEFPSETGHGLVKSFNSIYLLGTTDNLEGVQIYNKRQLVPFGEQVPFESVTRKLGSIFNFPMSGFNAGNYEQSQLSLTLTQTHASPESNVVPKGKLSTQPRPQLAAATSGTSATSATPATPSTSTRSATNAANSSASLASPESPARSDSQDGLANGSASPASSVIADSSVGSANAGEDLQKDVFIADLAEDELATGENAWFNEAPPAFPQDEARPLDKPLELKFIPAICYESIFPELMTSLHDASTNGIIMISNDSWFGNTRGPDEHLGIARMRALEMQKPMIRITNSGHTVLIDDKGKVIAAVPQDKLAILHTDFVPNEGITPYVRFHNLPLWALLLILLGIGGYLRQQNINRLQQDLEALVRP